MSGPETPAMAIDATEERVRAALEGIDCRFGRTRDGMLRVEVDRAHQHGVHARLKERAGFETVTLVTAVDHLAGGAVEPRFEVVHQFFSLAHNDRVRTSVRLATDDATLASVTDLWPGAAFMEREVYDMFGIRFEGHPNLKRLLMPEGYGHHPLRKDFPHQGIEPDRLYREWDRERRKTWHPSEG